MMSNDIRTHEMEWIHFDYPIEYCYNAIDFSEILEKSIYDDLLRQDEGITSLCREMQRQVEKMVL